MYRTSYFCTVVGVVQVSCSMWHSYVASAPALLKAVPIFESLSGTDENLSLRNSDEISPCTVVVQITTYNVIQTEPRNKATKLETNDISYKTVAMQMALEGTIIMSDDLKDILDNMYDARY